jgi:hypothetical protein
MMKERKKMGGREEKNSVAEKRSMSERKGGGSGINGQPVP